MQIGGGINDLIARQWNFEILQRLYTFYLTFKVIFITIFIFMQIKLFFWRHSGATFLDNLLFVRQESFPLADKHTSHSELVEITGLFRLSLLALG